MASSSTRPPRPAIKERVIDVDGFYRKYEVEEEDGISLIEKGDFCETETNRSRSRSNGSHNLNGQAQFQMRVPMPDQELRRRQSATAAESRRDSLNFSGVTGGTSSNNSNNLGRTLDTTRKRASPATNVNLGPSTWTNLSESPFQKRRRIDNNGTGTSTSAGHPSPLAGAATRLSPPSQTASVAGSSRQNYNAPLPSYHDSDKPVDQAVSPDISIIAHTEGPKRKRNASAFFPHMSTGGGKPLSKSSSSQSTEKTAVHLFAEEIIELSSSDEEEKIILSVPSKKMKFDRQYYHHTAKIPARRSRSSSVEFVDEKFGPPSKRARRLPSEHPDVPRQQPIPQPLLSPPPSEFNSEESDDGWDLNDPLRWKPMPISENKLENDLVDELDMEQLSIEEDYTRRMTLSPQPSQANTTWWNRPPPLPPRNDKEFIWDVVKKVPFFDFKPRPRPTAATIRYKRPWELDFHLHKLKPIASFKKSPGSISRIEQKGKWTAIASANTGGLPDNGNDIDQEDTSIHYNRSGSLLTWNKCVFVQPGHREKRDAYVLNNSESFKYYAVHDVKFDPSCDMFVSSGADKKVRVWTQLDDPNDNNHMDEFEGQPCIWKNTDSIEFGTAPHEIVFKPTSKESILAVAEKKLQIYAFEEQGAFHRCYARGGIDLSGRNSPHIVGSLVWGTGPSDNHLFISTEPTDLTLFTGVHRVYDIRTKSLIYSLEAIEAGDALAVNIEGSTIALLTRAPEDRHVLRLFDVKRKQSKAASSLYLERFPRRYDGFEGEVNCATFSPDGIFLAMARNDNHVHVYDMRMLEKGPIFDYLHSGELKAESATSLYGVCRAQWINSPQTGRMALVTGGEDGCVRLWNPTISSRNELNGTVIAEVNSDIAYFSIGDPYNGEHQLIVGDCTGEVTVFDNAI